jgi:hypothetical protein
VKQTPGPSGLSIESPTFGQMSRFATPNLELRGRRNPNERYNTLGFFMRISIFLEVNYDYARQHSLKKLGVSRTSESPGNHRIGPICFCKGVDVLTKECVERTERLDTRRFMTHATRKFVTQKKPATQEEMAGASSKLAVVFSRSFWRQFGSPAYCQIIVAIRWNHDGCGPAHC